MIEMIDEPLQVDREISADLSMLLLAWYDLQARDLPWRLSADPYRVWVSEIMLQQTRVETAKPYFERFVQTLPDVAALAQAQEDTITKLWEGLGYYSRVRNMQKAAQAMVERHRAELPSTYEELLTLPGIGDYTAGAIASIAYGVPVPAVDGNVLRVTARLLADFSDVGQASVKKAYRTLIAQRIPHDRAGDFNQALMELGAMVCVPGGAPKCLICPVSRICAGFEQGCAGELPVLPPKKMRKKQKRAVFLLINNGRVAIKKREDAGLLAGLWEFPNLEGTFTHIQLGEWLVVRGIQPDSISEIGDAKHIFSHVEWQMNGYLAVIGDSLPDGWRWVDRIQLSEEVTLPSAFQFYRAQADALLNET